MIRLAARRLWTRRVQALAPLIAMLAATLGFQSVLVSARSTQSHLQGVIAANWNPPYDLLARSASLVTGLKASDQLVRPGYLLTAKGGITMAQVGVVRSVAGVSVAAPLGVVAIEDLQGVGYALNVPSLPRSGQVSIYRLSTTLVTDGGRSRVPARPEYIVVEGTQAPYYWSPEYLKIAGGIIQCGDNVECYAAPALIPDLAGNQSLPPWTTDRFPYYTHITVPVVAVDPTAENALSGLQDCLAAGRTLVGADAITQQPYSGKITMARIPVLLNATPGFDESIQASVDIADQKSVSAEVATFSSLPSFEVIHGKEPFVNGGNLERLAYHPLSTMATTLAQSWSGSAGVGFSNGDDYRPWVDAVVDTTSPLSFSGKVPALAAEQALGTSTGFDPYVIGGGYRDDAPYESQDMAFRTVTAVGYAGNPRTVTTPFHTFDVIGKYKSSCVAAKSNLAGSGSDIYSNSSTVQPGGQNMGPNGSVTGFVPQMPEVMTNLAGGRYFSDPNRFVGGAGEAFFSVIRVKVSGTDVPGPTSQRRLERVAADIHQRTGLAVDIVKGSSTEMMSIGLPAGYFGRPAMTVHQTWLKENVAINFYNAISTTTVVMSIVVAVVAALLTMQTTYATVRRRRGELVLLRAVGWPSWRLALLMELEVLALGVLVALVAVVVAGFMILVSHPDEGVETGILVACPAAIVLTAAAGAGPAFIASRTRPLAALRGPGRLRQRRRRLVRGPFSLGIREALTTWRWQTLLGALATSVGALFLGAVLAILHDFRTSLDNTALAQQLSNEVGPFDVLLGVLAVALGATTAISVVLVATRERLPHFATLRAMGWSRVKVAQVVAGQALTVGLLGGVLGVIALSVLASRVKTGIALTVSSQVSPLLLGLTTGVVAAVGAIRLVYRRVIVTVLRVG